MNQKEQKQKAKEFIKRWEGKGNEKAERQRFWLDLHWGGILIAKFPRLTIKSIQMSLEKLVDSSIKKLEGKK